MMSTDPDLLYFDVLRHGETELSHTLRGSIDDALTERGWQQMHDTINQVQDPQWELIISSPLQRCQNFAQKIQQKYQCLLWIEADLQEMHFGVWEGQTTQWIYDHHPKELAQFWQTPTQYTPPSAESIVQFKQRIQRSLQRIHELMRQKQLQHALIVTHGGVIKVMKTLALQQPLDEVLKMSAALGEMSQFYMNDQQNLQLQHQDKA